jgi:hypothetical protein
MTPKEESHHWILAEAAFGNTFARYVLGWIRSDRAKPINPVALEWLKGHADGADTLKAEWAKCLLVEIEELTTYTVPVAQYELVRMSERARNDADERGGR